MVTLVKLTKMVDLAVGSPEPGAVNFNILHSLLHVIIQQSALQETEVEFHGDDAYRVQAFLDSAPPFPTLKLSEYTIYGELGRGPPPSPRPPTNKTRDERSRRPEDERKPQHGPIDEKTVAVIDSETTDKLKVGRRKSGALAVPGKPTKRGPSVSALEEEAEAKHARRDGDREERRRDREDKPREREERPREREERPRERDEKPRDREERPRDREDRPRDREERPRDREEKPRDREERPRDREEKARDREDRPRDREERPRFKEEKPRDREEKPRDREERPRDREERPRDREERPRDREERPRDREERPRDREERPRDREERPRDRDEKPRGKEERPREREEKPRDREDRRGEDDRGKSAQRGDEDKSKVKQKASTEGPADGKRRTTVVVVEPYNVMAGHDIPLVPAPIAGYVEPKKSVAILKKTASASLANTKSYQQLLRTVADLQAEVAALTEYHMPTNEELLEGVRSKAGIAPVGEMWEFLKLVKRMDGAEEGIEKLTSIIEDLAGNTPLTQDTASSVTKLVKDGDERSERIQSLEKRIWDIENRLGAAETRRSIERGSKPPAAEDKERPAKSDAAPAKSAAAATPTKAAAAPAPAAAQKSTTSPPATADASQLSRRSRQSVGRGSTGSVAHRDPIVLDGLSTQQMIDALKDEINVLRKEVDENSRAIRGVSKFAESMPTTTGTADPDELRTTVAQILGIDPTKVDRIGNLEERLNSSKVQLDTIDQNTSSQMEELQRQIMALEKELGAIQERLNAGSPATAAADNQDLTGLGELYNKITSLQTDIDSITATAGRLMDEREERKLHTDALIEQIELLKTIKADKEDLEDALADKADQNTINRKVSHDQFDAACDDLSRGLEEALAKLAQQEAIWQQALDDVQREVENKLDKVEISPLKDFVNSKLKLLQERLKALAALRKETEAAGTKHKLLRNVNCISCDKDAVMKMEDTEHVVSEPLPPNRSMRPYLTYELDAVRKQQRRLPGSRNLNHFESAVHEQQKRDKSREKKRHMETASADHLCNRYCGGSHTITTPQQRVTRMGHFLAQWGPEAIPLRKAQRPRALSIADKMMMTKGIVPPKTAPGTTDQPATPLTSPRSSHRPASAASVEVIKPAKLPSSTKRASQGSKHESPPRSTQSLPKAGSRGGTPPKEATPPREGTPTEAEAAPPPTEGEAPSAEEAAPADVDGGGDTGAVAEEGAAPEVLLEAIEEGEAPPPAEEAVPAPEAVEEAAPAEAAEAAPEAAEAEPPPPEPEAEASPAEPPPEEAPPGEEPAAEPEG